MNVGIVDRMGGGVCSCAIVRHAAACAGMNAAIAKYGSPAHTIDLGAKGCVSYRSEPLTNYRDFLDTNTGLYDASYPWMINRGVFMTPGDEEQWTMSVMHTTEHVDRYVDAFVGLCEALAA